MAMKISHTLVLFIYLIVIIYVRLCNSLSYDVSFLFHLSTIVEVTEFDRYMNKFIQNQSEGRESIRFPQCPRCQTKIRHCQRYKFLINRIQLWSEQIKRKQRDEISSKQLTEQREQLKHSIDKSFDEKVTMIFIRRLNDRTHIINTDELNYLKNTAEFFREIK